MGVWMRMCVCKCMRMGVAVGVVVFERSGARLQTAF